MTKYRVHNADAGEWLGDLSQMGIKADIICCSPPYEAQRNYSGVGTKLRGDAWVDWAADLFCRCLQVCRGPVVWVVDGEKPQTTQWSATPILLMAELKHRGVDLWHPSIYARHSLPGKFSVLRNNWEFIVVSSNGEVPQYADPTAAGAPPVIQTPGGNTRPRTASGTRSVSRTEFKVPAKTNVGNLLWCGAVGGGQMGSQLAHENEAPYPEFVPWVFIQSYVPDGGLVIDPFSGSGTTAAAAIKAKRNIRFLGCDIDKTQVELTRRRIKEASQHEPV